MSISEDGDKLVITATDIHPPRRIGHAIVDAYKGDFDIHYDREGYFVRISPNGKPPGSAGVAVAV